MATTAAMQGQADPEETGSIVRAPGKGPSRRTGFPRIAATIAIGSLTTLVVNTLPVFLSVVAKQLELADDQVGTLGFAEFGGVTLGTIGCASAARFADRLGWRSIAACAIVCIILANGLAALAATFPLLLLTRLIAGIGTGVCLAIVYGVLGESSQARALAIFNVSQLGLGGLAIGLLSTIAGQFGVAGLFLVVAATAGLGLPLSLLLPSGEASPEARSAIEEDGDQRLALLGLLAIGSTLLYFISGGALYAYLATMGHAWGGDLGSVENDVSISLFAGIAGGLVVSVLGSRFGTIRPLLTGYVLFLGSMAYFLAEHPIDGFLIAACTFAFGWNMLTPFQFAAVTEVDPSPKAAMLVNAGTMGGLALGPLFASMLVTPNFSSVLLMSLALGLVSLVVMMLILWISRRANQSS